MEKPTLHLGLHGRSYLFVLTSCNSASLDGSTSFSKSKDLKATAVQWEWLGRSFDLQAVRGQDVFLQDSVLKGPTCWDKRIRDGQASRNLMSAITSFAFRNKIGLYSEPDNFLSNEVTQRWLSEVGLAKKENSTRHVMNCSARIRKDSSYLGHLGVGDARFGGLLGEKCWMICAKHSFISSIRTWGPKSASARYCCHCGRVLTQRQPQMFWPCLYDHKAQLPIVDKDY